MIKTKEIKLTPQLLLQIWYKGSYKKLILLALSLALLLHVIYFFIVGLQTYMDTIWGVIFICCLYAILVLFLRYLRVRSFYFSKKNKIFYTPYHLEIDKQFIQKFKQDGTLDKLNWDNIVKVKKVGKNYITYFSKLNIIVIPMQAFSKEQDLEKFEEILKTRKLLA
jgi:hypothetical protein